MTASNDVNVFSILHSAFSCILQLTTYAVVRDFREEWCQDGQQRPPRLHSAAAAVSRPDSALSLSLLLLHSLHSLTHSLTNPLSSLITNAPATSPVRAETASRPPRTEPGSCVHTQTAPLLARPPLHWRSPPESRWFAQLDAPRRAVTDPSRSRRPSDRDPTRRRPREVSDLAGQETAYRNCIRYQWCWEALSVMQWFNKFVGTMPIALAFVQTVSLSVSTVKFATGRQHDVRQVACSLSPEVIFTTFAFSSEQNKEACCVRVCHGRQFDIFEDVFSSHASFTVRDTPHLSCYAFSLTVNTNGEPHETAGPGSSFRYKSGFAEARWQ